MAFERTITEFDVDPGAQQFVQGFRSEPGDPDPDLSVDGLSEGLIGRILGLFGGDRS
jgi:hypothetical protein